MHAHGPVTPADVKECLERSGYLLESRLVRSLTRAGFFVEPNVAHVDPRTGKARELDLVAEDGNGRWFAGAVVKTTFVIEAINNPFPVVLMTERPSTPNSDFESYIKFAWSPPDCEFQRQLLLYDEKQVNWERLFSQYCGLTRKSNGRQDLMAHHPEDLNTSLLRLAEYTENELEKFLEWTADEKGRYWRLFLWRPMLVVAGQLMLGRVTDSGELELEEAQLGRLEFNWHDGEDRKTTVVEFVRESYLVQHVESIRDQDNEIGQRMSACRGTVERS